CRGPGAAEEYGGVDRGADGRGVFSLSRRKRFEGGTDSDCERCAELLCAEFSAVGGDAGAACAEGGNEGSAGADDEGSDGGLDRQRRGVTDAIAQKRRSRWRGGE